MSTEMMPVERLEGHLVGPFRLTANGMEIQSEATLEDWSKVGLFLKQTNQAVQWWIGDWLNYGEARWGQMYDKAMELTGLDYGTLRNAKAIAQRYKLSRRHDNLSFSHHAEASVLDPDEADVILVQAETEELSTRQVRAIVRKKKSGTKEPTSSTETASSLTVREAIIKRLGGSPEWHTIQEIAEIIKHDSKRLFALDTVRTTLERRFIPTPELPYRVERFGEGEAAKWRIVKIIGTIAEPKEVAKWSHEIIPMMETIIREAKKSRAEISMSHLSDVANRLKKVLESMVAIVPPEVAKRSK